MKSNRLILITILLGLFTMAIPIPSFAQSFALKPNAVPNGIASALGEKFHQRLDITLGATAVQYRRAFKITAISEFTVVTSSVTATSNNSGVVAFFAGTPSTNPYKLAFGITGTNLNGKTVTAGKFSYLRSLCQRRVQARQNLVVAVHLDAQCAKMGAKVLDLFKSGNARIPRDCGHDYPPLLSMPRST